jgi:hypothetical protein
LSNGKEAKAPLLAAARVRRVAQSAVISAAVLAKRAQAVRLVREEVQRQRAKWRQRAAKEPKLGRKIESFSMV